MPSATFTSYIVCTTPRSGSTLLCKLLGATGRTGLPNSHFHTPSLARWFETYKLSRSDYSTDHAALDAIFAAAFERGTGDTGMFGLRLQRGSFDFFIQQAGILYPECQNDVERLQAAFGSTLFIYLTRENKLEQAISLVKAEQTGLWHKAANGEELERSSAPREPFYDPIEISRQIGELTRLDADWQLWFEREGVRPLRVSYDDLSRSPLGTLSRIVEMLGLDASVADNIDPPTAKLSDEISLVWAERFLGAKNI